MRLKTKIVIFVALYVLVFSMSLVISKNSVVYALTVSDSCSTLKTMGSTQSNVQIRRSNYTVMNRSVDFYEQITMSEQQVSSSNASLLEKTLEFNLTTTVIEVNFDLASHEVFLAIDGASQSFALRVNYTICYPNATLATRTPVTTIASTPMHFYIRDPPAGTWRIVASLIDPGETTAWIEAISYNNGTKLVTTLEKEQIHLIAGQNLYYKIPLTSADWFYLYVNRFAAAEVWIELRKPGAYDTAYKTYSNYASEFFPYKSNTPGVFLLKIVNRGSSDVFVEIAKPLGIQTQLNLNEGKTIKSRFQVDLEFYNITIHEYYDWIGFDGAATTAGMTARYLIIDPNLNVVLDSTSSSPDSFKEKLLSYPSLGSYCVAIFGSQYATATIKVTTSSSVENLGFARLDENWIFNESGQAHYVMILQSDKYFLFSGSTLSTHKLKFTLFNPNLTLVWNWGPSTGLAFCSPARPNVAFYILKIQGETNSSAIVHVRFEELEDYQIETPDCGNYYSSFPGDIIVAKLSVRDSEYVFQHAGLFGGKLYVALFDCNYNQKWSKSFSNWGETYFQRWRKGFENPPQGIWVQVVINIGSETAFTGVELSTMQTGDESRQVLTPFQSLETVETNNWWQLQMHKVYIGSPSWFGTVAQLLSVNNSYSYHPYATVWIYDSSLSELISSQTVDSNNRFKTNFWANPKPGTWLVVIAEFQISPQYANWDPLNFLVTYVSASDFQRDWPANLGGTLTAFSVPIQDCDYSITVQSNSTISDFSFDESRRSINFSATGPDMTNGFCVVTIPKQLADRPFSVLINGKPQSGVLSMENSTHILIHFSYLHSTHQITIVLPEFSSNTLLGLFLIATIPALIAWKKRSAKNRV